eukprot:6455526-Amphidinium_carterae.1
MRNRFASQLCRPPIPPEARGGGSTDASTSAEVSFENTHEKVPQIGTKIVPPPQKSPEHKDNKTPTK